MQAELPRLTHQASCWPGFSHSMACNGTANSRLSKRITIVWNLTQDSETPEFFNSLIFFCLSILSRHISPLLHYFPISKFQLLSTLNLPCFNWNIHDAGCRKEWVSREIQSLSYIYTMDMDSELLTTSSHAHTSAFHVCSQKCYCTSLPTQANQNYVFYMTTSLVMFFGLLLTHASFLPPHLYLKCDASECGALAEALSTLDRPEELLLVSWRLCDFFWLESQPVVGLATRHFWLTFNMWAEGTPDLFLKEAK